MVMKANSADHESVIATCRLFKVTDYRKLIKKLVNAYLTKLTCNF